MDIEQLIPAAQFCDHYQIEVAFIQSLNEFGLIQVVSIEQTPYIPLEEVQSLEKMIRLHYEMDINIEGIEAISHLLQRVDSLQKELGQLRNRLQFYEK